MVQHHLPQPRALHNGQRHITFSNHQNKILNKPQLNNVRFSIRPHISKKLHDDCRYGKCLLLAFFSFATITTLCIRIFVQEIFVQIQIILICNMLLHWCNAMFKIVSYKSFPKLGWTLKTWRIFKRVTYYTFHELHPLHINFNNVVVQHEKGPRLCYAMKGNFEYCIAIELN